MQIPKKYFEDKLALALSGISILVVIVTIVVLLLRAGLGGSDSYITGYRANLGIEAFQNGGFATSISFIIFSLVILASQTLLAWRSYLIERRLAIGVLATGLFLLVVCLIVSNALIVLH